MAELGGGGGNVPAKPATYRSLFASGEFRAMWLAQAISLTGDQLARVAITALVFDQTRSALLTGLVYAVTYLPWLIGGPLLGGLADRFPRRTVMIICQLLSAVLVALMAVPWMPLWVLAALLFVVVLVESPFLSARASLLVDVLPDDRYVLASATNLFTIQGAQVFGFMAGGGLVLAIGARPSLLLDAGSFLLAAALLRFFVRDRPSAAVAAAAELGSAWQRMKTGAVVVFGDRRLRGLVLLAWLAAFSVVPEGLAAPYTGGRATDVGLMLAAQPLGSVIGSLVLSRMIRPATRLELMGPLAVLACAPLVLFAFSLPFPVALLLLVLSGLGTAYNVPANATFMQSVPSERRGQAFGLVSAGLSAGQGLSIALAGALAQATKQPDLVIAVAGALGVLAALSVSNVGRLFRPAPSPAVH